MYVKEVRWSMFFGERAVTDSMVVLAFKTKRKRRF
jgi:hypothetical protein